MVADGVLPPPLQPHAVAAVVAFPEDQVVVGEGLAVAAVAVAGVAGGGAVPAVGAAREY